MKLFRDARRRAKQQLLQSMGLAAGTEDSDFQAEYAEYRGTVNSIRHVQTTMRAFIEAAKKLRVKSFLAARPAFERRRINAQPAGSNQHGGGDGQRSHQGIVTAAGQLGRHRVDHHRGCAGVDVQCGEERN